MTQPLPPEEEDIHWYTTEDVSELFSVNPKTVARWATRGWFEAKGVQVEKTPGGHRRYNKQHIDALRQSMIDEAVA